MSMEHELTVAEYIRLHEDEDYNPCTCCADCTYLYDCKESCGLCNCRCCLAQDKAHREWLSTLDLAKYVQKNPGLTQLQLCDTKHLNCGASVFAKLRRDAGDRLRREGKGHKGYSYRYYATRSSKKGTTND